MKKRSLGRLFIEMNKYDRLTIMTIKLTERQLINTIVRAIENIGNKSLTVFFVYQELNLRNINHSQQDFKFNLVFQYSNNHKLQQLFSRTNICTLIEISQINLNDLYCKLALSTFRVDHHLFFQRLRLKDAEIVTYANNIFTRMVNIEQDVLCLFEPSYEENILSNLKSYLKEFRNFERYQADLGYLPRSEQRNLQKSIFGQYTHKIQIHIPRHQLQSVYMLSVRYSNTLITQEEQLQQMLEEMDIQYDYCQQIGAQ